LTQITEVKLVLF